MHNSVSNNSLIMDTDDEDGIEEGKKPIEAGDGVESDSDSSSCDSPRQPISGSHQWPQSYRQSIDIYSSIQSPNLSFLGTPTLSRLSNSFITSSFRGKPPEIISNLIKPLIHQPTDEEQEQHQHDLPRGPSLPQIPEDKKLSVDAHGMPAGPPRCSYTQGAMNGINVLCGVGILSTPYALKEGGWIGLAMLVIFAAIAWYTGCLLANCLDSNKQLATYPDIGEAAFGTVGRIAISIVLYVELYACCVEYLILESDNLSSLFPDININIGALSINSHVFFAILAALIVMPSTWLRDLSSLSFISVGGVIASILVVICLFWLGLLDHVGFQNKGTAVNLPGIPIAVGLYGYCYSGHGVFPNIYSSLKKRDQYPSIIFTCIAFCTVLFAGAAVMGYTMFGESIESQFTLNLPHDLVTSKIAVWTTVANPITKFALTMTPLALSLEELLPPNRRTHLNIIMLRSALVISSLIVALSIPFFGLVMALVGSLLTMLVTFILPCACYLSILKGKVAWYQVVLCIFIIAVGVVCAVVGTYSSISRIAEKY